MPLYSDSVTFQNLIECEERDIQLLQIVKSKKKIAGETLKTLETVNFITWIYNLIWTLTWTWTRQNW